jgi:hypothetical protein
MGVLHHFQQYFSYNLPVNYIGGEKHRPAAGHCQTLSHNVVSSTPHHERDSNSQFVVFYKIHTCTCL